MFEQPDAKIILTLLRSDRVELSANSDTKLTFARQHAPYLFDDCGQEGPETVVHAAKVDAERALTNRVRATGRSHASCWVELVRADPMRDWYRLAKLTPARDNDRRFAHIVRLQDVFK
jgi:hypothetical protein